MQLTLANGTEITCMNGESTNRFIKGASRPAITFSFDGTQSMDELDALFNAENCTKIIVNGVHEWDNYTVRAELKKENEVVYVTMAKSMELDVIFDELEMVINE